MQRGVAVQRPDQKRSEDGLAKYLGDLRGWQDAADFATVLTKLDHLGVQSMNPPLQVHHGLTNWGRRKIGLKKGPNDGGIAGGLLSHADAEGAEELRHRLVGLARRLDGCFQFAELHLAERQKNVVLAREIIEKGPFAHVGSLGDVLDSGFQESLLSEKLECGAEKPFTDFGAAALAAIRSRLWYRRPGGRERFGTRRHNR